MSAVEGPILAKYRNLAVAYPGVLICHLSLYRLEDDDSRALGELWAIHSASELSSCTQREYETRRSTGPGVPLEVSIICKKVTIVLFWL